MRQELARMIFSLAASGWLVAAGAELQVPRPARHGFMRPDLATLRRWDGHRREALHASSAQPEAPAPAHLKGVANVATPATFSLLAAVPDATLRDQGECGSCWVWASTGMAEVALKAQYGIQDRLSVQYCQSGYQDPVNDQWSCIGGDLTDFCAYYNGSPHNPQPGVLVPWSNPQGAYADGAVNQYQSVSTVAAGAIGTQPCYAGVTLNHQTVATILDANHAPVSQAQAIANIQAALLNQQAVGFSFYTNFLASNGFDAFWDNQTDAALWTNAFEGGVYNSSDPDWGGHMVMIVGWNTSGTTPYWLLLNQWGTTPGRPDGCFRMPMAMNYGATFTYAVGSAGFTEACYGFETLTLATAGNVSPAGPAAAPAGAFLLPSATAVAGQVLTVEPRFTAGSPPFAYQWSLTRGASTQIVAGATGATLGLPNDAVPDYGVLDSSWLGATASLTVTNGAGQATFGPFTLGVAGAVLNPNSGFEATPDTTGWTAVDTTQVQPIQDGSPAHGGAGFALLTGAGLAKGNAGTFTSAPVTLPANAATPVSATYYLAMATQETLPLALATCTLQVVDGAGHLLKVLKTHTNMDVDHLTYLPETFDLTALNQGGTTVALQAVWADPDGATAFRLDDVQIQAGAAGTVNPTLAAFLPLEGAAGATVTLTGTQFTGATGVLFGRTRAASFTVVSPTQITAVVPWDGATGPITVATPAGTSSSGSTFFAAPSFISNAGSFVNNPITSSLWSGSSPADLTPASGVAKATVKLTGFNFTGATAVTFGGVTAPFTVNTNTQILATVPAGAISGPVVVTAPGGTATTQGSFTVQAGSPAGTLAPASGAAGSVVTLTGVGFLTTQSVTFNKTAAKVFTILSDLSLTAQVPSGATSGPVTVVTAAGSLSPSTSFTVLAPSITPPPSGTAGALMTVTGSGFLDVATVTFNGVAMPAFTVPDNSHLAFAVPYLAASGAYPLTLTSPEGTSAVVACAITVPPPSSAGFAPASGLVGSTVTVTGQYLTGATMVTLNGAGAPFLIVDDSHLTFTVPLTAATGLIAVTTPAGTWHSTTTYQVSLQVLMAQAPDGLIEAGTFPFKATVKGDPTGSVTWSILEGFAGGLVDSSGNYTAPAVAGTYHVVATSRLDTTASATAAVQVHSAAISTASGSPVTVIDLAYLMAAYGSRTGDPQFNVLADLNGDGVINDLDLALFLKSF